MFAGARGRAAVAAPFRGPDSNPVGAHAQLPDRWSKTENVEWVAEVPGRGWSSPIVVGKKVFLTSVTTEGKSKAPQTGVDFSNGRLIVSWTDNSNSTNDNPDGDDSRFDLYVARVTAQSAT